MTTILSITLFAAALYYFWFLISVRLGLKRLGQPTVENGDVFVSILVAARNESASIESCITALASQDFDHSRYEIVVINDGSTDDTAKILRSLSQDKKNIQVLTVNPTSPGKSGRKRSALEAGIRASKGDIILTTDADCVVGRSWITSMVHSFTPATALVAGPVLQLQGSSLVSKISALEFLGLMTVTAGLFGTGKPIVCNGANLAFRRSAFDAAGGYGPLSPFAEDEALLHRIMRRKLGTVSFCKNPKALVRTQAEPSLNSFWSRRVRWSSKHGQYENPWIYAKLAGLYLFFLFYLGMVFYAFTDTDIAMVVAGIGVAKILAEFQVLREGAECFGENFSFAHFLIAELFHIPYIVAASTAGQFAPKTWKGERLPA